MKYSNSYIYSCFPFLSDNKVSNCEKMKYLQNYIFGFTNDFVQETTFCIIKLVWFKCKSTHVFKNMYTFNYSMIILFAVILLTFIYVDKSHMLQNMKLPSKLFLKENLLAFIKYILRCFFVIICFFCFNFITNLL